MTTQTLVVILYFVAAALATGEAVGIPARVRLGWFGVAFAFIALAVDTAYLH